MTPPKPRKSTKFVHEVLPSTRTETQSETKGVISAGKAFVDPAIHSATTAGKDKSVAAVTSNRALITGSQRYGKPNEDSDIDLVLYLSRVETNLLVHLLKAEKQSDEDVTDYRNSSDDKERTFTSVRVGVLNLILCHTQEEWEIWKEGTHRCIIAAERSHDTLTNEQACQIFDKLRFERKSTF